MNVDPYKPFSFAKRLVAGGPCGDCERNPAAGFASITETNGVTTWYCHEDESPTCYEIAMRQTGTSGPADDILLQDIVEEDGVGLNDTHLVDIIRRIGTDAEAMGQMAEHMTRRVAALEITHKQQRQFMSLRHMQEQRELGGYAE